LLFIGATGVQSPSLEEWLVTHSLASEKNIRADVVTATEATSVHVVQIRDREAPHLHASHDATVTLLRGRGVIFLGETGVDMCAGDTLVLPRGAPHHFVNLGEQPAVALVTFAPPFDGTDQVPLDR
jgi:mannose-6-phosphate isomerase-like protein (cupin superfamily)